MLSPSRRRTAVRATALFGLLATAVAVWAVVVRGPHIIVPADPCRERPPLRTVEGVTLQPLAMQAFRRAERLAGRRIDVVESYRSCRAQGTACRRICGTTAGCPGACASPGLSAHQLGAAVDVTQAMLDDAGVVAALRRAGWCEPLPESDPGHFSFDGCR